MAEVLYDSPYEVHEFTIRTCLQELGENGFDHAHFEFVHSHPRPVKYCSKRCLPVYQTGRARVVQAARPCTHCGADYVPTRRDSRFCSGTCRVAAHRLRKRAAL